MSFSLQADKLTFNYGGDDVLHQLSFVVEKGDFLTILGPNGSGKSTLLKNISTELRPATGAVMLENQDIFRLPRKNLAQKMAVVPQETEVEFAFTVGEAVLMGRMPHQKRFQGDSPEDLAIVRHAMEQTHVWSLRDRMINQISGGERQRVIVARALAQEPRILLLDEPTSHLDIQHQLEVLELVARLNKEEGLTVIAVLHDLNLAAQFSKRIILMQQGSIVVEGDPRHVLTPANIQQTYHVETAVTCNMVTGRLNIQLLGKHSVQMPAGPCPRVHLVGGGGSGGELLEQLQRFGYPLSCGVLNIGDSDWQKAKELGIELAEELPFAEISEAAQLANLQLMQAADVIIVLPAPFGHGNLANLKQVVAAQRIGKKVIIVQQAGFMQRDFTNGQAEDLFEELLLHGAIQLASLQDVIEILGQ